MMWFVGAVLIYAFFLAPTADVSDMSTAGRILYWLILGGPALLFFYYCAYRGFTAIGVLS